jgi:hypothetical protein
MAAFPTALTRPDLPWQRFPALPSVVYVSVPAVGGALHLYVYSERTNETYERRCHRGKDALHQYVAWFAQQYG